MWEQEIEIGLHHNVMLKVYDRNVGFDRMLGAASVSIPTTPGAPRRETLPLSQVPAGLFKAAPESSITVLYR